MPSERQLSQVLSEFARTMLTDFPIQGILDQLVQRIVEIMPVTGAGVTLIAADRDPRYIAASDADSLRFEELQSEMGEGPCLAAYRSGQAIEIPDLERETRFLKFVPPAREAGLAAAFALPLRHGGRQLGALDLYRDTPGALSTESMASAQTLADVAAAYLINAQARDDLRAFSDRSHHAALHDGLTGLPNRVLLLERLGHAFRRGRRSHLTPAVFFVDLDRFKTVNDDHGHRAGDELLVATADRLSGLLRPGDTLARLSGDEFVILCEDAGTPTQAAAIATRLNTALAQPFLLSGTEVTITASIGVAYAERREVAPEQILHDADQAMYRAKREAAGGHHIFNPHEQRLVDHYASLERDLEEAVDRGELHLDYQPVVETVGRRIIGVEALLRWAHPTHGAVQPNVLIPIAEQSGTITAIGRWVLGQAWTDRRRWTPDSGVDGFTMSVNVSPLQLVSHRFADTVAAVLASGSTDPSLLTLEITESVFVRDGERALVVLNELQALGVRVALDDFGTGYSSLSYLMRFPVDTVKIDQSFVAYLGTGRASRAIVASVIRLAHDLDMTVTAEGVETAAQHQELTELGCDSCQGYYFARPMPAPRLDTLMRGRSGDNRLPTPKL